MEKILKHRIALAAIIGFLLGAIWFIALRYATYTSDAVHYHANFAMYVNGEQELFDSFTYYEEVQSCGGDELFNPRIRAHMHEQVNSVVHVHDAGATWGHLFANLGFTLGNSVLTTDTDVFTESDDAALTFILNGEETSSIANQTIRSEDVLLISFGDDDEEALTEQYESIPKDADEYNGKYDPSSCSGGEELTPANRLKEAIGVF